jgi:hypothetical protein
MSTFSAMPDTSSRPSSRRTAFASILTSVCTRILKPLAWMVTLYTPG